METTTRLDDLNAYNSTILNTLSGDALDAALVGVCKRYGRNDKAFREAAMNNTHPDDMVQALASRGLTLASVGIVSVSR